MNVVNVEAYRMPSDRYLNYVSDPLKTRIPEGEAGPEFLLPEDLMSCVCLEGYDPQHYVTGISCDPRTAAAEFAQTKAAFRKQPKFNVWHAVQSFQEGEISPDNAHLMGIWLAWLVWGRNYEAVICTHVDSDHIHNHIVVNTVPWTRGGEEFPSLGFLRRKAIGCCTKLSERFGLIVETNRIPVSGYEGDRAEIPKIVMEEIDESIRISESFREFLRRIRDKGYVYESAASPLLYLPGREQPVVLEKKYSEELIREKIYDTPLEERETKRENEWLTAFAQKTDVASLRGLQVLYFRFLARVCSVPIERAPIIFNDIYDQAPSCKEEAEFLVQNGLSEKKDVKKERERCDSAWKKQNRERENVYKQTQRAIVPDIERIDYLWEIIELLSRDMEEMRRRIKLCDHILKRADVLEKKFAIYDRSLETPGRAKENVRSV